VTHKAGDSDPLVEACEEVAALLGSLGVTNPMARLRPLFARVRHRWAGERVYIARYDALELAERDQAIQKDLAAGVPRKTIAAKTNLHPTTIWRRSKVEWEL